jgi:hypothetical protein
LRRRRGEPMDLEQHRADRNHEDGKIDEELHCPAHVMNSVQTKRRGRRAGSRRRPRGPAKINLQDLFCAKPPRPVARLIGAVGPGKRTIGRSAGVHVATHLRFGRGDRCRCLRGSSSRCGSGRPCRRGKRRRHNGCAHRRTWRCAWSRVWHRRRGLRDGSRQRRSRRGREASRGIHHRRHRGRKPVEPQQHAAKSDHQHGTIDR